jgi:hypothetical protein
MNEVIKEVKRQYGKFEIIKTIFIPTHIDIIIKNDLYHINKKDIAYLNNIKNKYEKKEAIKQFVNNKFKL